MTYNDYIEAATAYAEQAYNMAAISRHEREEAIAGCLAEILEYDAQTHGEALMAHLHTFLTNR